VAVVRNTTPDTLSLFHADAPPIHGAGCERCGGGCNTVTVRDERFVERAWPKSTWEVVEPPEVDGYVDASTDEAWLWTIPEAAPYDPAEHNATDVVAHLEQADDDERARVIAAETAGKARKTITEWSDR
jgi:hypothetical protein